jgi:hypothetical protein
MRFRTLTIVFITSLVILLAGIVPLAALAVVSIELSDVSYKDCPAALAEGNVTSGGNSLPASCFLITGKAKNTSGKTVYDADVFGRIYDANGEPVLQNRSRVGSLAEVPPGVSEFEVRITVPANQPTPLKLKQFKASGFTSSVQPSI